LSLLPELEEALLRLLREEHVEELAERLLTDFAGAGEAALLEDAATVLVAMCGPPALLTVLAAAPAGTPTRGCAVKALFEFGRQHPQVLRPCREEVAICVRGMVAERPEDYSLSRNADLLVGLCAVL